MLLVSDHEANNIIPLLRSSNTLQTGNENVYLTHFAYERHDKLCPSGSRHKAEAVTLPKINVKSVLINSKGMLYLELLNGYTMFGGKDRKEILQTTILRSKEAKSAAITLPGLRGWGHLLNRSDLEDICDAEGLRNN